MSSKTALNQVNMVYSVTIKAKPSGKYSGSITYSNTIHFDGIWFDNSGYLITQWQEFVKE